MNSAILREEIIEPTLKRADMYSEGSVNLLMGTAATESHMGKYLYQIKGPAIGIYQIEPNTHKDVLTNYVAYRPFLQKQLDLYAIGQNDDEHLLASLHYQTLIARFIYRRVKTALANADDVWGMANYWKDHYNTHLGKGTPEHFAIMYSRYLVSDGYI